MTQIEIALFRDTDQGPVGVFGSLQWTPTQRRGIPEGVVLPAGFSVDIKGTPVIQDIPASELPYWVWRVVEDVEGGHPKTRFLYVPDETETVNYRDLVEVDPATLDPVGPPPADVWSQALAAAVDGAVQTVIQIDEDGTPYLNLEA